MFGIGPWELVLIFFISLLLFGGKRLPGIATGLGQAVKNFKTALNEPQPPAATTTTPDQKLIADTTTSVDSPVNTNSKQHS